MANTDVNDGRPRGGARRLGAWAGAPLLVLLIPLIAMQFSREVDWDATDFLFMSVLLGGAGLAYALATMRVRSALHRAAIGLGALTVVFVIWVDAAVGIIGIFGGS